MGPFELARIAVRGIDHGKYTFALAQVLSVQFMVVRDNPSNAVAGPVVAQELLDRGGDESGVVAQALELVRMVEQGHDGAAEQVGGGLVSTEQEQHAAGDEFVFRGVFHGEPSVDGFSQTFEFMGSPGEVFYETFTFEDLGNGRTCLHAVSVAPSVEVRDAMVVAMESGVRDGYEKLDELLAQP